MLIRSQDKESLIAIDGNFVEILKYGDLSECSITVSTRDHSSLHVMARYSSVEKSLKVLDMIQEAYMDFEAAKITSTGLAAAAYTGNYRYDALESIEHEIKVLKGYAEMIRESVVFQMPEDSEVEV